ncbi:MAG: hypothetical protein ACJ8M1_06220 [Chthoniobacterales bacterium]
MRRVWTFVFPKASDDWLTIFRLGVGIELALYCLSARSGWLELLSNDAGTFSLRRISEALLSIESSLIPRVSWLVEVGQHLRVAESAVLRMIWAILLLSALLLTVGLFCRQAAVTAWFLHLACVKSTEAFAYGMDLFLSIALFYLMLAPLPDSKSLEIRVWRSSAHNPRMIGFFRRVLQLHLCVIYFFSGLAKCLGGNWWNGLNLWAALTRPPFNVLDPALIARWNFALAPLGIAICLVEISYPFLVWPKRTRTIWLGAVLAMHAGIGLAMGMYLFALIMIMLNLAAFAPDFILQRVFPRTLTGAAAANA